MGLEEWREKSAVAAIYARDSRSEPPAYNVSTTEPRVAVELLKSYVCALEKDKGMRCPDVDGGPRTKDLNIAATDAFSEQTRRVPNRVIARRVRGTATTST